MTDAFQDQRGRLLWGGWALALAACSGAPSGDPNPEAGVSGDGAPADGSAEASPQPEGGKGCAAACGAGEFCSTVGECIAEGTCRVTADCGSQQVCNAGECDIDSSCGGDEFEVTAVAPNLLVLLDRSCSMPQCSKYASLTPFVNCYNFSNVDKWEIALDAVSNLTTTFAGQVQWGLEFFPDATGTSCEQEAPIVPPAAGTESQIQTLLTDALDESDPNFAKGPCVTNITGVVAQASMDPSLEDPGRGNYVLLVTDGVEAGCGGSDDTTEATLADMAAQGVSTFVVGFGEQVDPTVLDRFAVAGGAPNPDPNRDFYQADDLDSLQSALRDIVASIVACDFQLDTEPTDPNLVYVWVNDSESLPRDDPDGWSYDAVSNRLTFQGAACEALRAGSYADIDVVFGCDIPVN